jgi:hypothetical protein
MTIFHALHCLTQATNEADRQRSLPGFGTGITVAVLQACGTSTLSIYDCTSAVETP